MGSRGRLSAFEWACMAVVGVAFLFRLDSARIRTVIWDTAWYTMLARSFAETGTFMLRWTSPDNPAFSGYWPPLYPIFLSPIAKIMGPTYAIAHTGAIVASGLLVLAVAWMTRDLYGRTPAFAAAALVAANAAFTQTDTQGMSESLLALMVSLTLWAFLKSLDRPPYLILAVVFGALAYLGKATLGIPLVAAGLVGLAAFRIYHRGWQRTVKSPIDITVAVVAVAGLLVVALTRTGRVGGLGVGVIDPVKEAISEPMWIPVFLFKLAFASAFLLVVTLPISLQLPNAMRAPRTEKTTALWLATVAPLVLGAVFTTSFYFTEKRPIVDFDNIRYLTPAIVPAIWLFLPHWNFTSLPWKPGAENARVAREHYVAYGAAVTTMFLLLALNPNAGVQNIQRFITFLELSIIPLGLAVWAMTTHFDVTSRTTADRTTIWKYVRTPAPKGNVRLFVVLVGLALVLGFFISAWYVAIALALAVILATPSNQARVVAMALLVLAATAADFTTPLPYEDATRAMERLPAGTLVAITEPAVYLAAIAPDNVGVRLIDERQPIPAGFDALLMDEAAQFQEWPDFIPVAAWDYDQRFSTALTLRLFLEEKVFGQKIEYRTERAFTLFVRNGTAAADAFTTG